MSAVAMTVPQARRHCCTIDGRVVRLSPQLAALLAHLLVAGPHRFAGFDELVAVLWPDPDRQPLGAAAVIRTGVTMLRGRGVVVENHHGRGYRLPPHGRRAAAARAA